MLRRATPCPIAQPSGSATENPFFQSWDTPFGAPPFARIKPEHFLPAYERAFAEHAAEIDTIANQKGPPSFDNTIVALENAGRALHRVEDLFGQLSSTDSNDELQAIDRDVSPRTAAHWNKVRTHEGLFARIDALYQKRNELGLTGEQMRVLERHHTKHRREGAVTSS